MDAGTGFSQQLYRVVPDAFLPKEWIMEKWDLGYYITAVAGGPPTPFLSRLPECNYVSVTNDSCADWQLTISVSFSVCLLCCQR